MGAANLGQMTDISLESKVKRKKEQEGFKSLHKFDRKLNVAQPYLMVVDK